MIISLLDCTLRDGGYVNDWCFGKEAIKGTIRLLEQTGVEMIEVDFLRDVEYNPGSDDIDINVARRDFDALLESVQAD